MNTLRIDPNQIQHRVAAQALGLNTNFLADHADRRGRGQGYAAAMSQMGVRALRYPGGEKSNEVFWARPPWNKPEPTLALIGPEARLVVESKLVSASGDFRVSPMNFDEFIEICREVGAEPVVCVGLGSAYVESRPGRLTGSTRAQVIENAVEWVRYANQSRGYGVKFWEIGNESYWRGSIAVLKAAEYTRDVIELSRAMKAIDPTIKIGANGHVDRNFVSSADGPGGPIWWQYLLERASGEIDFLVVHPYPCFEWGGYAYFTRHTPVFTEAIDQAVSALEAWAPPPAAARIRILATETNAFDWAASSWYQGTQPGWKWANDLGHALVLFDLIGQHLAHPRVDGVHLWNTRWFGSPSRLEDVLDDQNQLLPTGQALSLWGRFLKPCLQSFPSQAPGPAYATYDPQDQSLTLFLVNKQFNAHDIEIECNPIAPGTRGKSIVFTGQGPDDVCPILSEEAGWRPMQPSVRLALPPLSITVIQCETEK